MEFCVHLNHEEKMLGRGEGMISNEGSFWRDMRYVGVPGIDDLNQIGPGIVADFPKLATSAAHVNGHPLVWEEEGGGTGANGKFVADYQLVRGVNYMNIRGLEQHERRVHRLVCQPRATTARARPSGGAGRLFSSDRQHVAGRRGIRRRAGAAKK